MGAEAEEAGPGEQETRVVWTCPPVYPSGSAGKLGEVYREAESGSAAGVNPVCDQSSPV